jgi:hypothetical protein
MTASRFLGLVLLLIPLSSFAGRVRTLPTSSQEMPVIHLMTGRSTVIRFSSPPRKVIIGNQNYFNIEFIDSDVTLQPLANTSSNMFVYGDGFTYGFILKVNSGADYDDLVFIRAKAPHFATSPAEKPAAKPLAPKKDLPFLIVVPKKSKIDLHGAVFKWNESIKAFYADVFITVKGQNKISTDTVKIQILNGSNDVTAIKPVFEKDHLLPDTKGRARIFANVSLQQRLKIKIQINKEEMMFDLKWKK